MDGTDEKQLEMVQAALILLSMADAVWDPAQTSDDANATSAPETFVDDDTLEAAASLLLLSTHPIVNVGGQRASDSPSSQSVKHDDTPERDSSASSATNDAPDAPDAPNAPDVAHDAAPTTSNAADAASTVTSVENSHWAGLTADQQAVQQRRLNMTAWQRYQHNLQPYDHVDDQGSVIGRLW
ncbi:unnamed protein product [Aureobasidium mustum]|uniref:Uncharacterized protein n=1 Tax=Aureobasidium mustum TaxID=2773714 RepID=A0A9N8KAB1_9PEZI|nr:unnamed protein product [Aureobasidium mustum]